MKRFLLLSLFSVLLGIGDCFAQSSVNIHQKNGDVFSCSFKEKPIITYKENILCLSSTSVKIEYPLSDLVKLTFSENGSDIESLQVDGNDAEIRIFSINGQLLKSGTGSFMLDIKDLQSGAYIIKQGEITTKIIKK